MSRLAALRVGLIAAIVLQLLASLRLAEAASCPPSIVRVSDALQDTSTINLPNYRASFGIALSAGGGALKVQVGASAAFDGLLVLVNETVHASLYVQTAPIFQLAADVLNSLPETPSSLLPVRCFEAQLCCLLTLP